MKNLTYSEFCLWLDENYDKVEYILDYEDWSVVKVDGYYYYYEHEVEGSSDIFIEVQPIAELHYNIINDIQTNKPLDYLFDCRVCGEQIIDDEIIYWWFKEVKQLCM